MSNCFCGNSDSYLDCCEPIINRVQNAKSAEALMRSRYSAYCIHNADYLVETTHRSTRKFHQKAAILQWSTENHWLKLEIISSDKTIVEFKAHYLDASLKATVHHEKSTFVFENGSWFYLDGIFF